MSITMKTYFFELVVGADIFQSSSTNTISNLLYFIGVQIMNEIISNRNSSCVSFLEQNGKDFNNVK